METTTDRHEIGRVHIFESDRAGGKPRLVRVEPERWVSQQTAAGKETFCVTSDGRWWGVGGTELPDEQVPQWAREVIAKTGLPTVRAEAGPEVVAACEVCGERMNAAAMNSHLLAHYREREALEAAAIERPKRPGRPPAEH